MAGASGGMDASVTIITNISVLTTSIFVVVSTVSISTVIITIASSSSSIVSISSSSVVFISISWLQPCSLRRPSNAPKARMSVTEIYDSELWDS